MDAAARPAIRNTPATAPLFEKNFDAPVWTDSSGLSVGLATTKVEVEISPPAPVTTVVLVNTGGAVVVTCPSLSVVVKDTVEGTVVCAGGSEVVGVDDDT